MNDKLRKAYQQFFLKTEEGQHFMRVVEGMVTTNHESAEKNPELSRDHAQRAKGNREVLEHIKSVVAEVKKGKPIHS